MSRPIVTGRSIGSDMKILYRIGAALAGTLILLAPALWNGFPLLQYDTGGYIARWYEGTLEVSRSTVYGLFLNALTRPDFWPAILAQAALTVWILSLVSRLHGFGARAMIVVIATLSVVTALPFIVDVLLTDIFAGLAVLAIYSLLRFPDLLGRWERYALILFIAFSPAGFGGLPAPSFQPLLNGRNHESLPRSSVVIRTSASSTAKWTMQRPKLNSSSCGSRSRWYCNTASATVCLVRLFFSSKVAIGRPLMKMHRSSAFWVFLRSF